MEELTCFQAHSSNTPTLQFSCPRMEQIIKDAQNAMMLHTTMFKQPLVTLNTSVFEVPSQSLESFGEYGGEPGQLTLSTGNNNEVIQANVRTMVIKSKLWADQCEEDEKEDWANEIVGDSTNEADQNSEDEGVLSVGSPSLPKLAALQC